MNCYRVNRGQPELFTEILDKAVLLMDLKHKSADRFRLLKTLCTKGFQLIDLRTLSIVFGRVGTILPHEDILVHFLPGVFFHQPETQFRDDFTFPDTLRDLVVQI